MQAVDLTIVVKYHEFGHDVFIISLRLREGSQRKH